MGVVFESRSSDVLTDVLNTLRLRGRVFCRSEMSAPWGMRLPAGEYAHFHVIERGEAWLRLSGEAAAVRLESGDLVIVPHGRGHALGDSPEARAVPLELLRESSPEGPHLLRSGGGGAETRMICGSFEFASASENPLLLALPPLVVVRGRADHVDGWLARTLEMFAAEARDSGPGSELVISRLTDIIFVQGVRAWIEAQPNARVGWLGALGDRQIGAALGLMHRDPARDWSVSSLAAEVAMSRSRFAAKFAALVGEPPLSYLTRWRMHLAATALVAEDVTVAELALRVGYDSETAFSKAFKRRFGVSPVVYRRSVVSDQWPVVSDRNWPLTTDH